MQSAIDRFSLTLTKTQYSKGEQKLPNRQTDGLNFKELQKKQKNKCMIISLLTVLSSFPFILIVWNWVFMNSSSIIIVLFKTIIRIIWKVAINIICFNLLFCRLNNFPGCSEWIQAIPSTITVREFRAWKVLRLASTCRHRKIVCLVLCTDIESHQVTRVEQDRLQQWLV